MMPSVMVYSHVVVSPTFYYCPNPYSVILECLSDLALEAYDERHCMLFDTRSSPGWQELLPVPKSCRTFSGQIGLSGK